MNTFLLILFRFIHIITGALWVSVVVFFMFFITPAISATGESGKVFTEKLNKKNKFSIFMRSISLLTLISGVSLYWIVSGGLKTAWILSGPGLGFSIGAISGFIAFYMGGFGIRAAGKKLGDLQKEISEQGEKPTELQQNRMIRLQKNLNLAHTLDFIFLAVPITTIATARYLIFFREIMKRG